MMAKFSLIIVLVTAFCVIHESLYIPSGFSVTSTRRYNRSSLSAVPSTSDGAQYDSILQKLATRTSSTVGRIQNIRGQSSITTSDVTSNIVPSIDHLSSTKLQLPSIDVPSAPTDIPFSDLFGNTQPLVDSIRSNIEKLHSVDSPSVPTDIDIFGSTQQLVDSITNNFPNFFETTGVDPIVSLFLALVFVIAGFDDTKVDSPYDAGTSTYSIESAAKFYGSKPLFVLKRLLRLAYTTGGFNFKLLLDWRLGTLEKNEKKRAKEALVLANQCGPTFIKLGQALSIRTDLIPEAYALELRKLQDAVPPFASETAFEMIREELRISDLSEKFKSISPEPVASASIGQVYKAELLDGRVVAVKVQRPNVLGAIALDLYLLRILTPLQVKLNNAVRKVKTDQGDIDVVLSLVDEWGRGFVAEVDYRLEAYNTKQFGLAMQKRGLNAVTSPAVVEELSGPRVLVTEWMDGTRLDNDASPDVPRLCGVAINAYLTMLLDTGTLHCDPHPGNLLRTTDGRLCILDWGMTLEVPKDLQYSLLNFIAHINSEDYEALPEDFVSLGFTPANKLQQVKSSGLTEGLAFALRQLNKGDGPSKIRDRVKEEFKSRYGANLSDKELRLKAREEMIGRMQAQLQSEGVDVNGVTNIIEEMSKRNRELFKLPPYVLYVSRAFSTLEGIGLMVDKEYSILQECYPYLSKR